MDTIEEVENLEKIIGQLQAAHSEISVLAKKSPNDALNTFKLNMINKVIKRANNVLGEKYMPFDEFDSFKNDDLPSNSDVTLVLAQYMEEAERFRSDNVMMQHGRWYYVVGGESSGIPSGSPSKVKKK